MPTNVSGRRVTHAMKDVPFYVKKKTRQCVTRRARSNKLYHYTIPNRTSSCCALRTIMLPRIENAILLRENVWKPLIFDTNNLKIIHIMFPPVHVGTICLFHTSLYLGKNKSGKTGTVKGAVNLYKTFCTLELFRNWNSPLSNSILQKHVS